MADLRQTVCGSFYRICDCYWFTDLDYNM